VGAETIDADGANEAICDFAIGAIPWNGMDIPEFGRDIPGNGRDMPGKCNDMPENGRDMPGCANDMPDSFPKDEASCR
jgi:hypothetical protein